MLLSQEKQKLITNKYDEIISSYDKVKIDSSYNKFKQMYGRDALDMLSGEDLLKRLYATKEIDENGMMYALEFKKDFDYFGGIGGGSAYKYGMFFSKEENSWIKGTSKKNSSKISVDEAIIVAEETRKKLKELEIFVEKLIENNDSNMYEKMDKEFSTLHSGYFMKVWIVKFLHMMYPEHFSCFFGSEWRARVLQYLEIPSKAGLYSQNGQISTVANELNIRNVYFANTLYKIMPSIDLVKENLEASDLPDDEISEDILSIVRTPRSNQLFKLNNILYGAPGTGKTYSTMEYAIALIQNKTLEDIKSEYSTREKIMSKYREYSMNGQVVFTTFHQNYSYEDFIQGLRPTSNIDNLVFTQKDGIFKELCQTALKSDKNYVMIIDEINRANISKVFGELITLIEEDKRWGELNQLSLKLPSGSALAVPNNIYILGTMNSADKSISLIDAALRRRFKFIEVFPKYDLIVDSNLKGILEKINKELYKRHKSTDLLVGHSYFIDKSINDLVEIMNDQIIPLLYEYFFDNKDKVKEILNVSIDTYQFKIEESEIMRLKITKI